MLRRRELLKTLGIAAVANSVPGFAFAKADTHSRFVLVVLRGAADGWRSRRRMAMVTMPARGVNLRCNHPTAKRAC